MGDPDSQTGHCCSCLGSMEDTQCPVSTTGSHGAPLAPVCAALLHSTMRPHWPAQGVLLSLHLVTFVVFRVFKTPTSTPTWKRGSPPYSKLFCLVVRCSIQNALENDTQYKLTVLNETVAKPIPTSPLLSFPEPYLSSDLWTAHPNSFDSMPPASVDWTGPHLTF